MSIFTWDPRFEFRVASSGEWWWKTRKYARAATKKCEEKNFRCSAQSASWELFLLLFTCCLIDSSAVKLKNEDETVIIFDSIWFLLPHSWWSRRSSSSCTKLRPSNTQNSLNDTKERFSELWRALWNDVKWFRMLTEWQLEAMKTLAMHELSQQNLELEIRRSELNNGNLVYLRFEFNGKLE